MSAKEQPARISYFFGQGWKDIYRAIKLLWVKNAESAYLYSLKYREKGLMSMMGIYWLVCAISVVIHGSLLFVITSFLFIVVLFVFFFLVYILAAITWAIDRIYLTKKRIFTACYECKEKALIPTYICDNCGAEHTRLVPGKYGIFQRTCTGGNNQTYCGNKLPTTFFNGRKKLRAVCSSCKTSLTDKESVPICVPVVGGRSVGKTAFINSFAREFIEEIAPAKKWEIDFYNSEKKNMYASIIKDFNNGTTRMTKRSYDVKEASSISFSFFVKGKKFKPDRLVHLYDIAGEVFTDNNENEMQKQYEYCHGIAFLIDPFSIPSVRNSYQDELEREDIAGISKADINGIIDMFLNKLREVTGLSSNKMSSTPIAIIINKIDNSSLKMALGEEAVKKTLAKNSDFKSNYMDGEDFLCREFLAEHGMQSFIDIINMRFKVNRYFACTAIGHKRDEGKYRPEGTIEPMEWLFRQADNKMSKLWNDRDFTRIPVGLKKNMIRR